MEIIEAIAVAGFLPREEKQPYVRIAIRKTNTLKIFLMIFWGTKSLDSRKYIALSEKVIEIGRMLGRLAKGAAKQNSPKKCREREIMSRGRKPGCQRSTCRNSRRSSHSRSSHRRSSCSSRPGAHHRAFVRKTTPATAHRILSGLNLIRDIKVRQSFAPIHFFFEG